MKKSIESSDILMPMYVIEDIAQGLLRDNRCQINSISLSTCIDSLTDTINSEIGKLPPEMQKARAMVQVRNAIAGLRETTPELTQLAAAEDALPCPRAFGHAYLGFLAEISRGLNKAGDASGCGGDFALDSNSG